MSCTSLNETISNLVRAQAKNKLIEIYSQLSEPCIEAGKIKDATILLNYFHTLRAGKQHNLTFGRQEDAHEGLALLLESLEASHPRGIEILWLFYVRHRCEIACRACKKIRKVRQETIEPMELMIDLSEEQVTILRQNSESLPQDSELLLSVPLDSRKYVEGYIKNHVQTPRDYMCEYCHAKNTPGNPQIMQNYMLTRLSEIIAIIFKKYMSKSLRYFPQEMEFTSRNGPLKYRIVAQIEHFGTMAHGHYTCRALRRKPSGLHEARQERGVQRTVDFAPDDLTEQLSKLKLEHAIEADRAAAEESIGVFFMDDHDVRYCPEGFVPTRETYMVFYHLV